jgi:hypothetical protein
LLDEVALVARVVVAFGEEVRFEIDAPDPSVWRPVNGAGPLIETGWQGERVEHVAVWRLLPLMPGGARLPELRASRLAADGSVLETWRVEGKTVKVAPPPGADRGAGQSLLDVEADLPAGGGAVSAWLAAFILFVSGTAVAWLLMQRSSRTSLANPASGGQQLAGLLAELEQLRVQGARPTREQMMAWRLALPKVTTRSVPEGLLAQADGLLYQADEFDARTAGTWARDVRRWLVTLQAQEKPAPT